MENKEDNKMKNKEHVLVSACLLGMFCRYDGREKKNLEAESMRHICHLIPVCPEQAGGMGTPRMPSERKGEQVVNKAGEDVTCFYKKGAMEALKLAKLFDCKYALLKERSPSCGCNGIYDGTFTGALTEGQGVTAELLIKQGVQVFGESQIKELKEILENG
ncbi:DUF523 domain-containing protein [Lachnoclostridium edouardi]|uniref:DUF523 domain-containing protein n=1 Tax=Lachnoclostridium edouardi TaxID=1926283 RepID=UPI001FA83BEF|nr:DUF523 domain-containing protein [Lachnoclostridium edouardi]